MTTTITTTEGTREIVVRVSIECPDWCTEDHSGTHGLDDVWHTRTLAGEDEGTEVRLVLAEVDTLAGLKPEVSIWFEGNSIEHPGDRGSRWTVDDLRRLAGVCSEAADAMDALVQ